MLTNGRTEDQIPKHILKHFKHAIPFDYIFDAIELEGRGGTYDLYTSEGERSRVYKLVRRLGAVEVGIHLRQS